MRIEKLNQTTKKNLLEDLLKRSPNSYETVSYTHLTLPTKA